MIATARVEGLAVSMPASACMIWTRQRVSPGCDVRRLPRQPRGRTRRSADCRRQRGQACASPAFPRHRSPCGSRFCVRRRRRAAKTLLAAPAAPAGSSRHHALPQQMSALRFPNKADAVPGPQSADLPVRRAHRCVDRSRRSSGAGWWRARPRTAPMHAARSACRGLQGSAPADPPPSAIEFVVYKNADPCPRRRRNGSAGRRLRVFRRQHDGPARHGLDGCRRKAKRHLQPGPDANGAVARVVRSPDLSSSGSRSAFT